MVWLVAGATLAWIVAHITVADLLVCKRLGLARRTYGKWFPRLFRHGLFFRPYVYWCDPASELPQRLIRLKSLHMSIQAGVVALLLVGAFVFWNVGGEFTVGNVVLIVALIEFCWLFANWATTAGGLRADISALKRNASDIAPGSAYMLVVNNYLMKRPRNWPLDLVQAMAERGQSPMTMALTAAQRYAWAIDAGSADSLRVAVDDLQYSLRDKSVPQQVRSFAAAVYAFHTLSKGDVGEAVVWLEEGEKDTSSCGNWLGVAYAWQSVHEGNLDSARSHLDSVWRSLADGGEMSEYVLEQCRRILQDYEPPSAPSSTPTT